MLLLLDPHTIKASPKNDLKAQNTLSIEFVLWALLHISFLNTNSWGSFCNLKEKLYEVYIEGLSIDKIISSSTWFNLESKSASSSFNMESIFEFIFSFFSSFIFVSWFTYIWSFIFFATLMNWWVSNKNLTWFTKSFAFVDSYFLFIYFIISSLFLVIFSFGIFILNINSFSLGFAIFLLL